MDILGYSWIFLSDSLEYSWILLDILGYSWIFLSDSLEYSWILLDILGYSWIFLSDSLEYSWILLDILEYSWIFLAIFLDILGYLIFFYTFFILARHSLSPYQDWQQELLFEALNTVCVETFGYSFAHY